MMNLILILAFSALLPSSILCGTIASGNNPSKKLLSPQPPPSLRRPILSPSAKKLNSSSQGDLKNVIVKREIPVESTDMFYPDYRITAEMMPKRTATGLNKFIYVLRNSFDKSAPSPLETEAASKENSSFSRDVTGVLTRGGINRFSSPAAAVERRGQPVPQNDRRIYLRCYFNAVSCFKKKK